ncbi:CHAD domain-containing protein [Paraburkholderia sp. BCC1885]|uniref:CHAD domain-containing protein n=1 Tax=Paraburkholderia sp. BCC1885 TaxID=2562669 RepID=UPI00118212DB
MDDTQAARQERRLEADSAESHFAAYAQPLVDEALEHAAALKANSDADVLHKLRIALRRLRSLLWAYRPLLGRELDDQQRERFKSLAGAAGKTRDWDILTELLIETLGAREAPTERLRAARGAALDDSREALSHAGIQKVLRGALADASGALQDQAGGPTSLKRFARKRVASAEKSLSQRLRRAGRAKRSDYAAYHDVRKAGKKVRYLLEFFGPLLKKKQLKTAKRLKKLQKRFGTLNDVVASEELLRANRGVFGTDRDAEAAFKALEKQRKRRVRAASKLL